MNVLCKNCGRRFDPEQTNGVCPYCGRYSQNETAQAEPAVDPKIEQQEPRTKVIVMEKNQTSANRIGWTVVKVLAIILVLVAVGFPIAVFGRKTQLKNQTGIEAAPETMVEPGSPMIVGPMERKVVPGEAQILTGVRGLNPDTELARVFFRLEKQSRWESRWHATCYLEADGTYYSPANMYELERFYPELAKDTLDGYAFGSGNLAEGWFYFVVPKGVRDAVFWVQGRHEDRNFDVRATEMTGVQIHMEEEAFAE